MSIVVFGATGNLGRLVVRDLLSRGVAAHDIRASGRSVGRLTEFADQGVEILAVDYEDPATIDSALDGAEKVLLISGSDLSKRAAQHRMVIDSVKRHGVGQLVYTSVLRATETTLAIGPDHVATEKHILESGLPYTLLRNGWYTENYAGSVLGAAQSGVILGSAGQGKISSAARADFAEAAAVVLTTPGHEGKTYELGGHPDWTLPELAEVTSELLGRSVVYRDLTSEEHRKALEEAGMADAADFAVGLDADTKAGQLFTESQDLQRLLGHPSTPLIDALRPIAEQAASQH